MNRRRDWTRYPLRTCNSLHFCEICRKDITLGERYFDGGYGRRAHEKCVQDPRGAGDEKHD